MNLVETVLAYGAPTVDALVKKRNAEGWHLLGPVTSCQLDHQTHLVLTWYMPSPSQGPKDV